MPTCEDRVAESLYGWFKSRPGCQIVSFHPPSGKAYSSDLLRIPKRPGGTRTRDRYHVDIVVIEGPVLLLVELKCRLSESTDDIAKLREIRATYSVDQLLALIRNRATTDTDIAGVTELALGLGFEVQDQSGSPDDFITFCTGRERPVVVAGRSVSRGAARRFV